MKWSPRTVGEGSCLGALAERTQSRGPVQALRNVMCLILTLLNAVLGSGLHGGEPSGIPWASLATLSKSTEAVFLHGSSDRELVFRTLDSVVTADEDEAVGLQPNELNTSQSRVERFTSAQLVCFGNTPDPRIHGGLLLVDGSYLVGRIVDITNESVSIAGGWIRGEVPRSTIRAVLFAVSSDGKGLEETLQVSTAAEGRDDILFEVSGDRWEGLFLSLGASEPAKFKKELEFQVDDRLLRFDEGLLRFIVFSPRLTSMGGFQQERGFCVGLSDGSFLRAKKWEATQTQGFHAQLICGYPVDISNAEIDGGDGNDWNPLVSMIAAERVPGWTRLSELDFLRFRRLPLVGVPETVQPARLQLTPNRGVSVAEGARWGAIQMPVGSQLVIGGRDERMFDGKTSGRLRGSCLVTASRDQEGGVDRPVRAACRIDMVGPSGVLQALWEDRIGEGGESASFRAGPMRFRVVIDIEVPPGRAMILSAQRNTPLDAPCRVVWEDLIWEESD